MKDLEKFFGEVTTLVNAELDWLIPDSDREPKSLRSAIRWSLFAGGKHFRPALVFAAGRTFGAEDSMLVRTAAAVEMIHTYSLIHDDLPSMDDDDLRRGRETCHKKFGEATAILAGDALQALSFQSIGEDERLPAEMRIELISKLAQAAAKMVVGQQLDLEAEGKKALISEIEKIHTNKTGALICFSAEAGAIIGGSAEQDRQSIRNFADKLGLLFQITDDLLDVTQTTEALGKTAGKDASASKATYPGISGVRETERLAISVHAEAIENLNKIDKPTELLRQIADAILNRKS